MPSKNLCSDARRRWQDILLLFTCNCLSLSLCRWLEEPISTDKPKKLDARDEAVLKFANSLLKRTLSESFVGIPFTEECIASGNGGSAEARSARIAGSGGSGGGGGGSIGGIGQKERILLHVRSLSLELAKHKHKLAAQLVG